MVMVVPGSACQETGNASEVLLSTTKLADVELSAENMICTDELFVTAMLVICGTQLATTLTICR